LEGLAASAATNVHAPDSRVARPIAHLENFVGVLQIDGWRLSRAGRTERCHFSTFAGRTFAAGSTSSLLPAQLRSPLASQKSWVRTRSPV
jgi:hypothetical protein